MLPQLHRLNPTVLIGRRRTAKMVDLTDGASVQHIDLRVLVQGGGVGVGVCLSQMGEMEDSIRHAISQPETPVRRHKLGLSISLHYL